MESAKHSLCRLCLCSGDDFVDIPEEEDFQLEDTIMDLLNFTVVKRNDMPWLACPTCIEKLNDFRIFKNRCLQSKKTFESRYPEEQCTTIDAPHFCTIYAVQMKPNKIDKDFTFYGDDTQVSNYFLSEMMEQKESTSPEVPSVSCERTDNPQTSIKSESEELVPTDEQILPEDVEETDNQEVDTDLVKIEPIIIKAPQNHGAIEIHFQVKTKKMDDYPIYGDDTEVSGCLMNDMLEQKKNRSHEVPSRNSGKTKTLHLSLQSENEVWGSPDEQIVPEDGEKSNVLEVDSSQVKIKPIIIKAPQIGEEIEVHFQENTQVPSTSSYPP